MDILILFFFAAFEGYREQLMKQSGAKWWERTVYNGFGNPRIVQRTRIFKIFTVAYHVPLALFWIGLCWIMGHLEFVPAFAAIEDWFFFRFHPDEEIDDTVWAHKHFGGKYIVIAGERLFLPYLYFLLISASLLLYLGRWFLWGPVGA